MLQRIFRVAKVAAAAVSEAMQCSECLKLQARLDTVSLKAGENYEKAEAWAKAASERGQQIVELHDSLVAAKELYKRYESKWQACLKELQTREFAHEKFIESLGAGEHMAIEYGEQGTLATLRYNPELYVPVPFGEGAADE